MLVAGMGNVSISTDPNEVIQKRKIRLTSNGQLWNSKVVAYRNFLILEKEKSLYSMSLLITLSALHLATRFVFIDLLLR